jgi:glutaredoxin-like YruB-family protein
MKKITSHDNLISNLDNENKSFVLLYKEGSEMSTCSYKNLEELNDEKIMTVDVTNVKDIHSKYDINSVPTLLIFTGKKFSKSVKGCNKTEYYKSLIDNKLFTSKDNKDKKQKRVIVYSTPTCTWCNTLKTYLKNNDIRYTDIDVSKDQKSAEEMVRKSGKQGVPQTSINGQMIMGFDKLKIDQLLELKTN